jgi:hypothetical protein
MGQAACPQCGRAWGIADSSAPRKLRCPACQFQFTAPASLLSAAAAAKPIAPANQLGEDAGRPAHWPWIVAGLTAMVVAFAASWWIAQLINQDPYAPRNTGTSALADADLSAGRGQGSPAGSATQPATAGLDASPQRPPRDPNAVVTDINTRPGGQGRQRGQGRLAQGPNQLPQNFQQQFNQFRNRLALPLKDQLGASDDEWKMLQPRIEKVTALETGLGRNALDLGAAGVRVLVAGGNPTRPPTEAAAMQRATQELNRALRNRNATTDQIAQSVKAVRDAREALNKALSAAQDELQKSVTPRQEALLVTLGVLE